MTVRVLVVDDSVVAREVVRRVLSKVDGVEVIGTARDVFEARDMILEHQPDVMTLDIDMPKMDGLEFLRRLLPQHPIPVVVVSGQDGRRKEAYDSGAVAFVCKPRAYLAGQGVEEMQGMLCAAVVKAGGAPDEIQDTPRKTGPPARSVIAVGASTGGTQAIQLVLQGLPGDMPPVLVVQHMPVGYTATFAQRLSELSALTVREAKDGDVPCTGEAYVAPGGMHMELLGEPGNFSLRVFEAEKVSGHRPSVDVLFRSVARAARSKAIGVLLTGMGRDGALGLGEMRDQGAMTLAQDERTSVVWGMPRAAWESGAAKELIEISSVSYRVQVWTKKAA